jgi:hypothetical protein
MRAIITTRQGLFWIVISGITLSASAGFAKTLPATSELVTPLPKAEVIADAVVVTPGSATAQPAPAPVEAVPVQPVQPVVAEPHHTTIVQEHETNYMSTIAISAIMGAVVGALVGGSIYYLGSRDHAARIGYWAAGGVLVGTGVGLVQIAAQENRINEASSSGLPTDPAPTYRLALLRTTF